MEVAVAEPDAKVREFARLLALEITEFEPEDLAPGSLAMKLTLSVCLRRCELDVAYSEIALDRLRRSLMEASGLSPAEEPLPLPFPDRTQRVVNACHYTYGLIARAAGRMGLSKVAAVEEGMRAWDRLAGARPGRRQERAR